MFTTIQITFGASQLNHNVFYVVIAQVDSDSNVFREWQHVSLVSYLLQFLFQIGFVLLDQSFLAHTICTSSTFI